MKILTYILLTASLLLVACQASAAPASSTGGSNNDASKPTTPAQTAYPPPGAPASTPATAATGYPAQAGSAATDNPPAAQVNNPGTPNPAATEQTALGSSFPPQPGDQDMSQSKFFVDSATLQPNPNHPGWTDLMVTGSLPTPCNIPRVQVNPPEQNKILVNAYSIFPKDKICNQMIQPFSGRIAILGGYPSGKYTVIINGKTMGELNMP